MATNGSLTQLMSAGADAFSNLWDVTFTPPSIIKSLLTYGQGDGTTWSIRVSDFAPPEFKAGTYPTDYKGVQLTRMNTKFEADRTLKFTFRLDAAYNLYKDLKAWKHIFFDPSGDGNMAFGMYNDAISKGDRYGTIEVVGYQSTQAIALGDLASNSLTTNVGAHYTFKDVVCVETGEPKYSRGDSNAVTVDATFMFGRFIEPGSSIETGSDTIPTVSTTA